ncbi:DM13 domain-containing protein [Streptomyces sp. NPDC001941]|uniref:DM13 domain-containing protein n=1 Tax=Streptomyces sp. NPDC001941 TaxID=3154659 RepID=UPI00332C4A89
MRGVRKSGRFLRGPWGIGALTVAVLAVGLGLYWFQPWKLVTDTTVREALPTASAPAAQPKPGQAARGPVTEATGTFISHEHATSGTVKILRLPDGTRTLRLEGLNTSDGPDLRIWLTDAEVKEGRDGWRVFDDGEYVSLGKLKGNKGDQNYALPAGLDLDAYRSVTIWCDRFDVSFGAAELTKA